MGVRRKKVVGVVNYTSTTDKVYKIKTIDIEIAVARLFDFRKYNIVPNISWGFHGLHECDLFLVNSSKYCYEVEIKISKSDFLKDFEKRHGHKSNYIKDFYYAMPETLYEKVKEQIPEHAGAITCEVSRGRVVANIVKNPISNKNAKKISLEDELKILRLATMRIWSLKEKIVKLNNESK